MRVDKKVERLRSEVDEVMRDILKFRFMPQLLQLICIY